MISKKLQMVHVKWVDSSYMANGWKTRSSDNFWSMEDMETESCGFLYRETDDLIEITHSAHANQIMSPYAIPKCAIIKMRKLKPTKRKR